MNNACKIYRHFKGSYYCVLHTEVVDSETGEHCVVYQSLQDGTIYVRPRDVFFSPVDKAKYPDVKQVNRFEFVGCEEEIDTV